MKSKLDLDSKMQEQPLPFELSSPSIVFGHKGAKGAL